MKQEIDGAIPMKCVVQTADIIKLMNQQFPPDQQIPLDADVTVEVPGGGDWSGMDLKVTALVIRWKRNPERRWPEKVLRDRKEEQP